MLEYLLFSMQNTNHPLLKSITYFQENKANITQKKDLPINFISMDEQQRIYTDQGKLKVSLYKMLLFKQIQEHLKSGELHVENSYNYQAYTHFLIPINKWEKHRDEYLQKAGIVHFKEAGETLLDIDKILNRQFKRVNQNLPMNPFISIDSHGKWKTHKLQEDEFSQEEKQRLTKLLYPPKRSVPILRVLSQVHQLSNYLSFFQRQGVVIYSHLDEAGQLTFSTVFSADKPESAPLLNGLTHNELLIPNAHSTDDHGHSLPYFAITYFIGIDLRPRIANLKHKELFSIDTVLTYIHYTKHYLIWSDF